MRRIYLNQTPPAGKPQFILISDDPRPDIPPTEVIPGECWVIEGRGWIEPTFHTLESLGALAESEGYELAILADDVSDYDFLVLDWQIVGLLASALSQLFAEGHISEGHPAYEALCALEGLWSEHQRRWEEPVGRVSKVGKSQVVPPQEFDRRL